MAFGVSISGKKPVATVTVGSVTIPIYAAPVTVKVTKPIDATDAKIGGGAEVAYNFNQYVGMSLGLDWLGQFSLVSGNVTLGLPFHPAASFFPNLITTPFIQAGVATAYSGAGKFNGNASTTTEIGDYIKFGHLWKGQFLAGAAWGQWSNVGPAYGGTRYHIFFGWSKGF